MELGGENTRTGAGTEDAQIEDKQQAVDDGNTAHGIGTDLADHDVVQQIDEVGDTHLHDDGNGDRENTLEKHPVADVAI